MSTLTEEKGMTKALTHLLVTMFLGNVAWIIALPAITDVTMDAVCPGRDECSLAIYLTAFQQAITGIGSMVITPLIGNLSDAYGRKTLLTLPLTVAILPLAVLAYSREKSFFYAYYVLRTVGAIVCDASMMCLALAYVADVIPEGKRATAFGILNGVVSAAFVCGTLTARFLSTSQTFQMAAFASMAAAVYMRIFLKETIRSPIHNSIIQEALLLKSEQPSSSNSETTRKSKAFKNVPSLDDIRCILRSSKTLSQIAVIAFFTSLSESGVQTILLYFLKAQFQFSKNQFADLMLIVGIAGMVSQLLLMPLLTPVIGEVKLLSFGLLITSFNMFFNSIAWSVFVPYVVAGFAVFSIFTAPCMRSIASKQVSPDEQGKAQGCISGISSFANIISPLVFSPLTALFLSEGAPFHFPGFSLMCIGLTTVVAFVLSLRIQIGPIIPIHKSNDNQTLQ
ncbi:hypothetical protein V2J09_020055 [Rumex salicifolius]